MEAQTTVTKDADLSNSLRNIHKNYNKLNLSASVVLILIKKRLVMIKMLCHDLKLNNKENKKQVKELKVNDKKLICISNFAEFCLS